MTRSNCRRRSSRRSGTAPSPPSGCASRRRSAAVRTRMTSSSCGCPSSRPEHAGVTSHAMCASGHCRRTRFSTGSVCTTSPIALGLMIRMRLGRDGRAIGVIGRLLRAGRCRRGAARATRTVPAVPAAAARTARSPGTAPASRPTVYCGCRRIARSSRSMPAPTDHRRRRMPSMSTSTGVGPAVVVVQHDEVRALGVEVGEAVRVDLPQRPPGAAEDRCRGRRGPSRRGRRGGASCRAGARRRSARRSRSPSSAAPSAASARRRGRCARSSPTTAPTPAGRASRGRSR